MLSDGETPSNILCLFAISEKNSLCRGNNAGEYKQRGKRGKNN